MKKILGSIAVLALVVPVGAQAADLPVAAPSYKAPVVAPVPAYNWTGLYIGGSLGGEWEKIDGNFVFPPPATWSVTNSRFAWDAHIGGQYQFGMVVLGVEGMFTGLSNSGSFGTSSCNPTTSCLAGATMRANLVDDIWSAGGRLGLAFGAFMPYLSGGYASTRVDNHLTDFTGGNSSRTTHNGAYGGGGVDWQVWSTPGGALVAGIEYRHYEFQSVTVAPTIDATGVVNTFNTWTLKPHADTIEARLSWLFNWGGPVVARY
jgi:outer membrane immunogenic protein